MNVLDRVPRSSSRSSCPGKASRHARQQGRPRPSARRRPRACCSPATSIVSVDGVSGGTRRACASRSRTHRCAGAPTDGCQATTPAGDHRPAQRRTADLPPHAALRRRRPKRMRIGFAYDQVQHVRPAGRGRRGEGERRTRCGASRSRTVSALARIFTTPRRASRSPGVVGSYETTRQAFTLEHGDRPADPGHHLAVAGDREPVPVPAAGRRPHLLGAGREGARPARSRSA